MGQKIAIPLKATDMGFFSFFLEAPCTGRTPRTTHATRHTRHTSHTAHRPASVDRRPKPGPGLGLRFRRSSLSVGDGEVREDLRRTDERQERAVRNLVQSFAFGAPRVGGGHRHAWGRRPVQSLLPRASGNVNTHHPVCDCNGIKR
jgi:hypothetical protein